MKELNLIMAISKFHKKGHHVPLESHDQYELVYYKYGQGITLIDGKKYTFSPNTFVLIPPHAEHDETHQADCKLFFIRIQTTEKLPTGVFTDKKNVIYKIVNDIVSESRNQNVSYKDMITIKLNELFITLDRLTECNPSHHHNQNKNFEYIINYISESYHDKIIFKNLAKQLNYSYDYFQHRFKELTGDSPQQFLIRKRIAAAETMLKDKDLSCTYIAYRCGFSSSAQFSAIFKRDKGISPQQYRDQLNK